MKIKSKKGFSLVELLVVITIIAILSVVAYVAVGGQTAKARNSRRMQDLTAIQSALEIFFIENDSNYPSVLDDGNAGDWSDDLAPQYMPKVPLDPVADVEYEYATASKKYQIAATLENDDGTTKAYVIGNSTTDLINVGCGYVIHDGSCVPYSL